MRRLSLSVLLGLGTLVACETPPQSSAEPPPRFVVQGGNYVNRSVYVQAVCDTAIGNLLYVADWKEAAITVVPGGCRQ